MSSTNLSATTDQSDETIGYSRAEFTPLSPAELGARFPHLEVTELLGHGGMGMVYKGRQPLLDRPVAIKVIRPELSADDLFQERFLREARTLAKLRHPFIVSVFDICQAGDLYGLVMEYVEGTSLRQLLDRKESPLTERDALDFVPQMAEALQHAHEAGVVHRDIKPENILIDSRGRVRLVDFGLATLFGPQGQARTADDERVVGTLRYMAPEQLAAPQTVDHRADIYSTGVVFYEMLARELPGNDRVPPSNKAATDARLDPIVLRAIEKERERRYQEARSLHADLTNLARTPESTINLVQHVPAPPDQVFAVWTEPAQMSDWYAPTDDFGPTVGEVDLQVGGDYRVGMMLPGKTEPRYVAGQYCCVEPGKKLSFTWAWQPLAPGWNETQVTVQFLPDPGGTQVVLTHERFRSEPDKVSHTQGWQGCLGRLARKFGASE